MEELGIGRPSTYSTIMQTIQDRGYVFKRGQALIPTFVAFAVTNLLEKHFPRLVDFQFTASMENVLDEIANGDESAVDFLRPFYFGGDIGDADSVARQGGLKRLVTERLGEIDARGINSIPLFRDDAGRDVVVRVGKYGPYLQRTRARRARGRRRRPGRDPRGPGPRRADPGEGGRALRRRGQRRAQARRAPGHRRADRDQVGPLRALRVDRREERVAAVQPVARAPDARRGAEAAVAAPAGRQGAGRAGDLRLARPLRAIREEGRRLPVAGRARSRSSQSRSTRRSRCSPRPRRGAGARPRRRCGRWASTRPPRSRW